MTPQMMQMMDNNADNNALMQIMDIDDTDNNDAATDNDADDNAAM